MTLLGYADDAKLAADVATIDAALPVTLTDAAGKPLAADHPLLARNPGLKTTRCEVIKFAGTPGGLIRTDAAADAVLGAAAVTARTKAEPTKPVAITKAAIDVYTAALKAAVPAAEPVIAMAEMAGLSSLKKKQP